MSFIFEGSRDGASREIPILINTKRFFLIFLTPLVRLPRDFVVAQLAEHAFKRDE